MTSVPSYLAELFSLSGRVAVVTGGSSGIGRAMAEALARAGARVVIVARRVGPLADTVAELRAHGCEAAYVAADLTGLEEAREAADRAAEVFGEPDICVNSAGINLRPPLPGLDDDQWDATMAVNLRAPHLFGQRYGPGMAERGWGRIINVASQQAFRAFGNSGAYGASKAGVVALTRSQAEAWSPHGVCCNTLVPGFVITPLTAVAAADPVRVAAMRDRTMIGRNGLPADFAGAAVFLASPAAAFVTGHTLFVDGGFAAH
ncbi:SDR family NAD(P)-dependent oxidoreductase [Thermomonospora amylolytica]|uniref:SDR family NAD(P)-dependent oxidoreductase n=1 Tax=Thermomonospora amylolytica TaxID=1411117 RepID=UPI000E6C4119|nr:SDR family oxidoreductase [Thermomonospora amylolytica]